MDSFAPITIRKRRFMLLVAVFACIVMIPLLILYAVGMRLSFAQGDNTITTVGGIFVASSIDGSVIYVDGIAHGNMGMFSNDFLIQDVKEGYHDISVVKDGYMAWNKKVYVEPYFVTRGYSLLIPTEIVLEEVKDVKVVDTIFGTSSLQYSVPTSTNPLLGRNSKIWINDNVINVEWLGSVEKTPDYFCLKGRSSCVSTTTIKFDQKIKSLNLYNGRSDVFIVGETDGIYLVEIDNRSDRINHPIFKGKYKDLKIYDGYLYINGLKKTYKISNL